MCKNTMRFQNRILALVLAMITLCTCLPLAVFADEAPIRLFINDVEQTLENPCVIDEGEVYIPLCEVFFKMGIYLNWDENLKCYVGESNNGEVKVTTGLDYVEVDWVYIELPAPVKEINGVCMVPIYAVEDIAGTTPAVYDEAQNAVYITAPLRVSDTDKFDLAKVFDTELRDIPKTDMMDGTDIFSLDGYENDSMACKTVEVENMPFDKALSVEMKSVTPFPTVVYHVQTETIVRGGTFAAGDVGVATFWARATKITDETGSAKFRFCYESNGNWEKATGDVHSVGYEWTRFVLPLYQPFYDMPVNASGIKLGVGGKAQIIEFADIHLYNFGNQVDPSVIKPDTASDEISYTGEEEDALWRKEAWRRIEKYRKNDMVVTVTDEEGNPIEGATVKADLTENEFKYGVAICASEVIGDDTSSATSDNRLARLRQEILDDYANTAVSGNEMKFMTGVDNYRQGAKMVNKYLDSGLNVRGHALHYGTADTTNNVWLTGGEKNAVWSALDDQKFLNKEYTVEEVKDAMYMIMAPKVHMFKGTVYEWDGSNELAFTDLIGGNYGGWETNAYSYRLAKGIDPKVCLNANETGIESANDASNLGVVDQLIEYVEEMRKYRAPIDSLGVQAHASLYNYPQGWWHIFNQLSQHADRVEITEYDFYNTNYSKAPQHLHDTFLALFSCPKASTFIIWGYWDPMHWRRYGPFYDDWFNPKPELAMWDNMIHNEFSTHEAAVTDKDGKAVIRGLRGTYDITVTTPDGVSGTGEFMLTKSDNTERDNWVNVTIKNGETVFDTCNHYETYAGNNSEGKVKFEDWNEARADFLAKYGDKDLIGVFNYCDKNGERLPDIHDGLYNTYWYGGDNDYILCEMIEKAQRGTVSVDFRAPKGEEYNYVIETSADGKSWTKLYEGSSKEKVTVDFEDTMYIRIKSVGNEYMGVSEVNIYAENDK